MYEYPAENIQIWIHTKLFRGIKISEGNLKISERMR